MTKPSLIIGLLLCTTAWCDPQDGATHQEILAEAERLDLVLEREKRLKTSLIRVKQIIEQKKPTKKDGPVAHAIVSLEAIPPKGVGQVQTQSVSLSTLREVTEEAAALVTTYLGPPTSAPTSGTTKEEIKVPKDRDGRLSALEAQLVKLEESRLIEKGETVSKMMGVLDTTRQAIRESKKKPSPEAPIPATTSFVSQTIHEATGESQGEEQAGAEAEDLEVAKMFAEGADKATGFFKDAVKRLQPLLTEEREIADLRNGIPPDSKEPPSSPPNSPPTEPPSEPPTQAPPSIGDLGNPGQGLGPDGGQDPGQGPNPGEQGAEDDALAEEQAQPEPTPEPEPEPEPEDQLAENEDQSGASGGGGQGGGGAGAGGEGGGGTGGGSGPGIPFGNAFSSFQGSRSGPDINTTPIARAGKVVTTDDAPPKFSAPPATPYTPDLKSVARSFPNRGARSIASVDSSKEAPAVGESTQSGNSGGGSVGGITPPTSDSLFPGGNAIAAAQAALGGGQASSVGSNFQGNPFNGRPSYPNTNGSGIRTQRAGYGGGGGSVNDEVAPKGIRILKKNNRALSLDESAFNKDFGLGRGIMKHVGQWCASKGIYRSEVCDNPGKVTAARTPSGSSKEPSKKTR